MKEIGFFCGWSPCTSCWILGQSLMTARNQMTTNPHGVLPKNRRLDVETGNPQMPKRKSSLFQLRILFLPIVRDSTQKSPPFQSRWAPFRWEEALVLQAGERVAQLMSELLMHRLWGTGGAPAASNSLSWRSDEVGIRWVFGGWWYIKLVDKRSFFWPTSSCKTSVDGYAW